MNILITAGATNVKIDKIRVITNIFTGRTGLFLAKEFKKRNNEVTLIINSRWISRLPSNIKIITFSYFDDFRKIIENKLKNNFYDVIIHSAAVSDYRVKREFQGKISSKIKNLNISLVPTTKIIRCLRKLAPESFIVQFKLEIDSHRLIEKAYTSLIDNGSNLVVANAFCDLSNLHYQAFIIDKNKKVYKVNSKRSLACCLINLISFKKRLPAYQ